MNYMNAGLIIAVALIVGIIGGIIGGMLSSPLGTGLTAENYVTQAEFQNFTVMQNQTHINMATALANRDIVVQNATLQFVLDNWVLQNP